MWKDVYDLVIVGGGIAGLNAARCAHARRPGAQILVLEASDRWGGAVYTVRQQGLQWEAGAGRIERRHRRTRALLQRYGLTLAPIEGTRVLRSRRHAPDGESFKDLARDLLAATASMRPSDLRERTLFDVAQDVLGTDRADRFRTLFGYDAEFNIANATETLQALRSVFGPQARYDVCREGLGALIDGLVRELQQAPQRIHLRRNAPVLTLQPRADAHGFVLTVAGGEPVYARHVLLATPPDVVVQQRWVSPSLAALLASTLHPVPLVRVYAQYERPWTLPRAVGDGLARQVIPVQPNHGLVMVAYVDEARARAWLPFEGRGHHADLARRVRDGLEDMYGREAVHALGRPQWIRMYPWRHAVHVWKPGHDIARTRRTILDRAAREGLLLAGEAYSRHHGWIEGALQSSEDAILRLWGPA